MRRGRFLCSHSEGCSEQSCSALHSQAYHIRCDLKSLSNSDFQTVPCGKNTYHTPVHHANSLRSPYSTPQRQLIYDWLRKERCLPQVLRAAETRPRKVTVPVLPADLFCLIILFSKKNTDNTTQPDDIPQK